MVTTLKWACTSRGLGWSQFLGSNGCDLADSVESGEREDFELRRHGIMMGYLAIAGSSEMLQVLFLFRPCVKCKF